MKRPHSSLLRTGLILVLALLAPASAVAQRRFKPPPDYGALTPKDGEEGMRILEAVRRGGIAGDYALDFELRVLPRRGPPHAFTGRLYGTRNENGPLTRIYLREGGGGTLQWLMQNGPSPLLLRIGADGATTPLPASGIFSPILDTQITCFDLLMPFVYWNDFVHEGVVRFRGRPTHRFLVYPPEDGIEGFARVTGGVRMYLDTEFKALVQAEVLDPEGRPLRTLTITDFKKISGQWVVKSVDVRDERTRDKTRFLVRAALLDRCWPPQVFDPSAFADTPLYIPAEEWSGL